MSEYVTLGKQDCYNLTVPMSAIQKISVVPKSLCQKGEFYPTWVDSYAGTYFGGPSGLPPVNIGHPGRDVRFETGVIGNDGCLWNVKLLLDYNRSAMDIIPGRGSYWTGMHERLIKTPIPLTDITYEEAYLIQELLFDWERTEIVLDIEPYHNNINETINLKLVADGGQETEFNITVFSTDCRWICTEKDNLVGCIRWEC